MTYEGLIPEFRSRCCPRTVEALQPHLREFVQRAVTFRDLPRVRWHPPQRGGPFVEDRRHQHRRRLFDADQRSRRMGPGPRRTVSRPAARRPAALLDSFVEIGLGYLSLDRPSGTLSGGEAQRTKMIRHLGSSLTDVTYVFDEPTIGLHPHDVQRMNDLLLQLRDKGNTVLVVEHDPEPWRSPTTSWTSAPVPARNGGTVCFEGTVEDLRRSGTLTGRHLDDHPALKSSVRRPPASWRSGVQAPTTCRTSTSTSRSVSSCVVTGVAGSGKSSLVEGSMPKGCRVVYVDQTAIRGSRRSNPATYTGMLDPIRKAFAKANGVKPGLFSPNSDGACPNCNGAGVIFTDLGFMDTASPRPARCAKGSGSRPQCSSTAWVVGTSARCWRCRRPRRWTSSPTARLGCPPPTPS
jgi:excinuclease UvrABC ATPase subunit